MGVMSGYSDGTIPITSVQYAFTMAVLNIGLFTFAYTVGVIGAIGDANSQASRRFQISVSAMVIIAAPSPTNNKAMAASSCLPVARVSCSSRLTSLSTRVIPSRACSFPQHHFVERYEMPQQFIKRITDYFAHRWESIKSNEKELVTAAELLEELPPCVRYDAVECMTADALNKVPLFARVEEGFIHALTQKMEPVSTSVGETLVRQGEVCDGLYIVLKGKLSIVINGRPVNEVGKGSCIGEQSMLTGQPAGATVVSLSFCELYRLRREPFEELSHKFVETFEGFKQAAKLEAKNAKKQAKVKNAKRGPGGDGQLHGAALLRQKTAGIRAMAAMKAKMGGGDDHLVDVNDNGNAGDEGNALAKFKKIIRGMKLIPIQPHSRTRAVWALLTLCSLAYESLALPFKIVFVGNTIDSGLTALDVLSDIVLILDILLRRYLAYTEDGRLIEDLKQLKLRWRRKKTLVPLCISAFPCSVFLAIWPLCDARILQSIRLIRAGRLVPHLFFRDSVQRQQPSNLEELMRTMRYSAFDLQFAMTKLAPLLTMYIMCVHYVACGYWAIVHIITPPDSGVDGILTPLGPLWGNQSIPSLDIKIGESKWLPESAYLKYGTMMRYYLRAFYFATCNLTGLGAAVVPYAVPSVLFTLGCFIIGVLVFAYLTSAIVTLVMQADAAAVSYKQKNLQLLGFMQDAGIDSSVIHRASRWLMQWWHAHGGANLDGTIAELPATLAIEIKMYVFHESTRHNPFWAPSRKGEILTPKELYRVAHDLRFEVYNNDEWVLRKGMLNDQFFIVAFGLLQIILDDGTAHIAGRRRMSTQQTNLSNTVVAELGRGECVGEHSAILKGKCEASVKAKGSVELLVIPRETMLRLTQRNPLIKHRLHVLMNMRFAENLYLTTGKVSINSAATAVRCMRKFVSVWRARKAERERQPTPPPRDASAPAPEPSDSLSLKESPTLPRPKGLHFQADDPMVA